jgi:hypothetical protein
MKYSQVCRPLGPGHNVPADSDLASSIIQFEPRLWSSGQSSWLQIQRSGLDSQRYHIFWDVMGLERGPLSLVSTIEELTE